MPQSINTLNPAAASIAHTLFGFEPGQIYNQLYSQQFKNPEFSKDVNYAEPETPLFAGGPLGSSSDAFEPCYTKNEMKAQTASC